MSNNDFDDIENEIDENDFQDENNDFASAPSPKIEEKTEETLKKKKIEPKTEKIFPFKSSNSDSKPIKSPTSSNNEKTMVELNKKLKEANKGLETLDFEIQKFNRFSNNLEIFKIWNTVILSITAFSIGIILSYFIIISLNEDEKAKKIQKLLAEYNVTVVLEKNMLQLYTQNQKGELFKTSEFSVLQIQK